MDGTEMCSVVSKDNVSTCAHLGLTLGKNILYYEKHLPSASNLTGIFSTAIETQGKTKGFFPSFSFTSANKW